MINYESYKLKLLKELERIEYEKKALNKAEDELSEIICCQDYPEMPNVEPIEDDYDKQTAEINAALVRIENKTYGVCLSCGKEINNLRLEAIPESALCRDCAELAEQDEN